MVENPRFPPLLENWKIELGNQSRRKIGAFTSNIYIHLPRVCILVGLHDHMFSHDKTNVNVWWLRNEAMCKCVVVEKPKLVKLVCLLLSPVRFGVRVARGVSLGCRNMKSL